MQQNRRIGPALASIILAGLILSACGPAPTPQVIIQTQLVPQIVEQTQIVAGTSVVQEVTTTPVPAYTGPKTRVNLWHTIPTDTETFFVGELMPKFSAQHPECNVVTRNMTTHRPARAPVCQSWVRWFG